MWTVNTGFIAWIINVSLCVLLFLAFLIIASISYYEYTRSPGRRGSSLFAFYAVPNIIAVLPLVVMITILIIFIIIFGLYSLPLISSFAVITFYILSGVYTMRVRGKCSKEGPAPVGDLDFVVCYEGPVNAWYNYRKNKIYISDKLLGRLNDEELRAIYYHEEGHKKYRHLALLSGSIIGVWLIFFSLAFTVFVVTTFKIVNVTFWDYVLLLVIIVSVAASLSATSIVWNWVSEHESDVYSAGKVGTKPLITAFVKLYVYRWLEKSGISTYNARVSLDLNVEAIVKDPGKTRFSRIFVLLLKRSLHSALGVVRATSIYEVPIPDTHPPLEYRILVLWRSLSTQ